MTPAIYIDSNVFVAAFETTGELSDHAWSILDAVSRGEVHAHTSELTLAELLPKPIELRSELLVELYEGLIRTDGFLSVSAVSRSVLVKAAEIRAGHKTTRLPDAIHIATALDTDCQALVTDDHRLRPPASVLLVRLGPDSLKLIRALAK